MQLNAITSLLMAATTRSPTVKILRACHAAGKKNFCQRVEAASFIFRPLVAFLGFCSDWQIGGDCYSRNESPIPKETT